MSLPVAILAGGLATRLRPLSEQVPKSLVDVAGKPFILHQLELLRRNGLEEIVLCVGYLGEQIRKELGDGSRWSVCIQYAFDGRVPLGTGGALLHALPLLGDAFFVLYGDSYLDCNYGAVEEAFWHSQKLGLMTVFRNSNQWDKSNIVFENGCIRRYDKRNYIPEMKHIDYGLGVLQAEALQGYDANQPLDLAIVYQNLLAKDQLAGYEVTQRFYEIGSPAGLQEMRDYLTKRS